MAGNGKHFAQVMDWIKGEMGLSEINTIAAVEVNAGGIWITLEDGSIKSIIVIDVDPEDGIDEEPDYGKLE